MRILSWTLTICLLTSLAARAQQLSSDVVATGEAPIVIDYDAARLSKVATAVRVTDKITLDGLLEEPDWNLAVPASGFVQFRPRTGEPAQEQTEARFLYDEDNLYVGIICFDSDVAHMVVNGLKEDFAWNETDTVGVTIDSLHDRNSGFYFQANPAGARRDQQIFNDSQASQDWDGVWDVKVSRNDEGWIAEFMIPFKTLRFSNSPTQEWGLNMTRRTLRLSEESHWSPIPIRYNGYRVSQSGVLGGLENINQGLNLKVKPFVTAGITQVRRADGQLQSVQTLTKLKDYDGGVDLKYSLTPSLTLDATYRTDFAQVEVDQQQVNLTRFNLFFPEKRDFFLENASTFNVGPGINQFGGGTGNLIPFFSRRIGLSASGTPIPIVGGARVSGKVSQYDIGLLAMKTEASGLTPSNNFLVGRLRRNLFRNSWVGTLATNRSSTVQRDYNRVYGTDAHFQFDRLEFDSFVLRSDTPGRPGGNQARRFQTGWRDDELSVSAEYNSVQADFNPEIGFVRRKNVTQYSGDFAWRPLLSGQAVRNLNFGANLDYYGGSSSGKVETRTQDFNAGIQFENGGFATFNVTETFDRLANGLQIPSGNPHLTIATGDYNYRSYSLRFNTSPSWKIGGNTTVNWGEFYNGHRKLFTGAVNLNLNVHTGINLSYDRNQVQLPNGSFTTSLVGTRATYAFTPRTSIDAFIQYNADTHQVSSNIRFDFMHHPLSNLYIVYNDTRDTVAGQLKERALIVKLTNLFSF